MDEIAELWCVRDRRAGITVLLLSAEIITTEEKCSPSP